MRKTDATEWHHIAKFSDGEALDRMGQTWSRKSDKTSTLDYAAWNDAKGDRVHTAEELSLARLDEARAHIEQLRAGQDAEQEMPFQLESSYTLLPLEKLKGAEAREAREHVMDNLGATAKVLDEAQRQGFIEMRRDDERGYTPSFAGRRPGDDAIVNRLRDGQPNREEGALRDRYPPILKGDPKEVHIVATGEDALAIWSNRERENKPKPTVIVAGDNVGEAVQLQHVRDTLRRADKPPVLWPSERMSRQQSKEAGKEVAEASGKQVSVKLATAPANQLQHDLHQERASMAKKEAARLKEKQNTLGG
ncbi:MAG: relaxase/mobilization nuclease family protein [uncultured bacterium]|nr:MAG: relaxase/mobilization nuclease family protein [uncultured bacterium]